MKAEVFATSSKYKFSLHNFDTFLDTYIEIHLYSRVEVKKNMFFSDIYMLSNHCFIPK